MNDALRRDEPGSVGLPATLGARLDRTVEHHLAATGIPGAAVLVAVRGTLVHEGAYGLAQHHDAAGPLPHPRPVEVATRFDVASLTKVAVTTALVMALVDDGLLELDDPVERHLAQPGTFAGAGIRVGHLLEHRAGLPAWYPLFARTRDRGAALALLTRLPRRPVGDARVYSDLGMMLLAAVVERAADTPLAELLAERVTGPLALDATGFRPPPALRDRCAATSTGNPAERRMIATGEPFPLPALPDDFTGWRNHTLVGEVNDANAAHAFGGIAGHAGLFSTASDLMVLAQTLLAGGRYGGVELWRPGTVQRFTTGGRHPDQAFGFWRRRLHALAATGPERDDSFGHRGFTGCELVVSPRRQLALVLLSNRLHSEQDPPTDDGPLWRVVVDTVLAAIASDG